MVQKRHLGINNWYRMKKLLNLLMFMAIGFGINLFFSRIALTLRIPLYLDNVGTLLGAILGGSFPGAFIGYLTNIVNGIQDADTLYYGVVSIIIAMLATWFHHKKWFRSVGKTLLAIVLFALVGGGLGSDGHDGALALAGLQADVRHAQKLVQAGVGDDAHGVVRVGIVGEAADELRLAGGGLLYVLFGDHISEDLF